MLVMPGYISGPAGSGSVHVESFMHRLQHLWVSTHAEVIIRTPDGDTLVPGRHMGLGEFFSKPVDIVEIAVRFVFVLFLKLGIVEAFVIEL